METCANSADCEEGNFCLTSGEGIKECREADCITSQIVAFKNTVMMPILIEGCNVDADCYAGERCNTNSQTCEAFGCRDTELDCRAGEFCNISTEPDRRLFCHCGICIQ